jgi:hypothetical protein
VKIKALDRTFESNFNTSKPRRWIACLFTSLGYGKPNMRGKNPGRDSTAKILVNTRVALEQLREQLEEEFQKLQPAGKSAKVTDEDDDDDAPNIIWSPRFNSGAFGVAWEDTLQIILDEFQDFEGVWVIVDKDGKKAPESTGSSANDDPVTAELMRLLASGDVDENESSESHEATEDVEMTSD